MLGRANGSKSWWFYPCRVRNLPVLDRRLLRYGAAQLSASELSRRVQSKCRYRPRREDGKRPAGAGQSKKKKSLRLHFLGRDGTRVERDLRPTVRHARNFYLLCADDTAD